MATRPFIATTGRIGTSTTRISTTAPTGATALTAASAAREAALVAAAVAAAREPVQVVVRDNTSFVKAYDTKQLAEKLRPRRTLVVGQSPRAGDFVPVGTPIDLTVTVKEGLPLDGLVNLHPGIAERFRSKNVGDLLATLDDTDAKNVFTRADATDYDKLSTNDKAVVNEYMRAKLGVDPADTAGAKKAYGDMKFVVDF